MSFLMSAPQTRRIAGLTTDNTDGHGCKETNFRSSNLAASDSRIRVIRVIRGSTICETSPADFRRRLVKMEFAEGTGPIIVRLLRTPSGVQAVFEAPNCCDSLTGGCPSSVRIQPDSATDAPPTRAGESGISQTPLPQSPDQVALISINHRKSSQ